MVVVSQSRAKNISIFSRPKKPSHAASSGDYPLRDIERTSFASAMRVSRKRSANDILAPLKTAC